MTEPTRADKDKARALVVACGADDLYGHEAHVCIAAIAAALAEARGEAAYEQVQKSPHLKEYASHVPDIERVRTYHSKMATGVFQAWDKVAEGHRPYTQSLDEACYLCALLAEIAGLTAERDAIREAAEAAAIELHGTLARLSNRASAVEAERDEALSEIDHLKSDLAAARMEREQILAERDRLAAELVKCGREVDTLLKAWPTIGPSCVWKCEGGWYAEVPVTSPCYMYRFDTREAAVRAAAGLPPTPSHEPSGEKGGDT